MSETGAISIPCQRCRAPLLGHESKCPACRKRLLPPDWILPLAGFLVTALVGLGILASRDLKQMADAGTGTAEEVYAAAQTFVEQHDSVHGAATFDRLSQTEVERWRGRRWRVAGNATTRDTSGTPVRLLYSCVMVQDRGGWSLQEIRIETIR